MIRVTVKITCEASSQFWIYPLRSSTPEKKPDDTSTCLLLFSINIKSIWSQSEASFQWFIYKHIKNALLAKHYRLKSLWFFFLPLFELVLKPKQNSIQRSVRAKASENVGYLFLLLKRLSGGIRAHSGNVTTSLRLLCSYFLKKEQLFVRKLTEIFLQEVEMNEWENRFQDKKHIRLMEIEKPTRWPSIDDLPRFMIRELIVLSDCWWVSIAPTFKGWRRFFLVWSNIKIYFNQYFQSLETWKRENPPQK